ncbi:MULTISPECIES: HNH endonuclease [Cyanophyceae]|uniref:HNH endonuclease n=1 Tax=Cyanophyceae TaxID=3028117 RepID=UPI001684D407|nr:HNH endonuclease [Trichocoleus sp. FACHB-40]MBD2001890.1 HNH endonuclease [Trichocoleus sp. FACHB-40]
MPMDRSLYPPNWDEIATQIKQAANWLCRECGRQCRRPGETLVEFCKRRNQPWDEVMAHPQRFTLTVAHLDHIPANCDPSNLKALCSGCHCRYDLKAMPLKKRLKRERLGQLSLPI